jgi:FkbM family methyltransferase
VKFMYRLVSRVVSKSTRMRKLALRANTVLSRLQTSKEITFYSHKLLIPSRHPLLQVHKSSFRDLALRVASRHVFRAGKNHYVDVGANVGDTAAVIESSAPIEEGVHGTLVEPSEFFMGYLKHNSLQLNNPILLKMFASPEYPTAPIKGVFHHWTSNAEIVPVGEDVVADVNRQVNLATLVRGNTALVKIDCEGLDVSILSAMFRYGLHNFPVLYFENSILKSEDLDKFTNLLDDLTEYYESVIVSDSGGRLVFSGQLNTSCLDLCRYQFLVNSSTPGSLPYLDMMVFPKGSADFLEVQHEVRNFPVP